MLSARLYKIDHFLNGVDGVLGVKSWNQAQAELLSVITVITAFGQP